MLEMFVIIKWNGCKGCILIVRNIVPLVEKYVVNVLILFQQYKLTTRSVERFRFKSLTCTAIYTIYIYIYIFKKK